MTINLAAERERRGLPPYGSPKQAPRVRLTEPCSTPECELPRQDEANARCWRCALARDRELKRARNRANYYRRAARQKELV